MHRRILREFAAAHAIAVDDLDPWSFGWDIRHAGARAGVADPLLADLEAFWAARYFTSDYALEDRPMPGAVGYVARVAELADVLYLTGRDAPNMGEGTRQSLARHGLAGELWMKPDPDHTDLGWKIEAIGRLQDRGVAATFENEPGNANRFVAAFPDAMHFLVDTYHSPSAPPPDPALIRIDGFE